MKPSTGFDLLAVEQSSDSFCIAKQSDLIKYEAEEVSFLLSFLWDF